MHAVAESRKVPSSNPPLVNGDDTWELRHGFDAQHNTEEFLAMLNSVCDQLQVK
jgi:hypothetical protein